MAKCMLCNDTGCYGSDSHGVPMRCLCQDDVAALGQMLSTQDLEVTRAILEQRTESLTRPIRVVRYEPEAVAVRCGTVTIDCNGRQAHKAKITVDGQDLTQMNWKSFRLEGRIPGPITLTVEFLPGSSAPPPDRTTPAAPEE